MLVAGCCCIRIKFLSVIVVVAMLSLVAGGKVQAFQVSANRKPRLSRRASRRRYSATAAASAAFRHSDGIIIRSALRKVFASPSLSPFAKPAATDTIIGICTSTCSSSQHQQWNHRHQRLDRIELLRRPRI